VTRYGNQQQPVDQLPDMGDPTKLMGQRPPATQNVNVTGLGAGASAGISVPVGGPAAGAR